MGNPSSNFMLAGWVPSPPCSMNVHPNTKNAVRDGCCSVSYKWTDWIVWMDNGYLRAGWSIEQLMLLINLPCYPLETTLVWKICWRKKTMMHIAWITSVAHIAGSYKSNPWHDYSRHGLNMHGLQFVSNIALFFCCFCLMLSQTLQFQLIFFATAGKAGRGGALWEGNWLAENFFGTVQ